MYTDSIHTDNKINFVYIFDLPSNPRKDLGYGRKNCTKDKPKNSPVKYFELFSFFVICPHKSQNTIIFKSIQKSMSHHHRTPPYRYESNKSWPIACRKEHYNFVKEIFY